MPYYRSSIVSLAGFALIAVACGDTAPSPTEAVMLDVRGGNGKNRNTELVCHMDDNGAFIPLYVALPAVDAHLRHGDGQEGDEIPGMDGYVFGSECEPVPVPVPLCQCNFVGAMAAWPHPLNLTIIESTDGTLCRQLVSDDLILFGVFNEPDLGCSALVRLDGLEVFSDNASPLNEDCYNACRDQARSICGN